MRSSASNAREAKPSAVSSGPGRSAAGSGSASSIAALASRSSTLGLTRVEVMGIPAGVRTGNRRSAQENREWERR
ncbi:hypothetical protein DEF23_26310 [Marinitenerispora sediminis]|uniref:Uncharacterized protein n=1 Tax=Marinitenerispora sediminis TaxID=1931232 RepID=A0A368T1I3_9ACTN|nr:hypothetical protein DEF28_26165 [Marinitenerispora sediminis]RCV47719.1 hypothetical protein DEF23_26310 [Marinitenerispora sediminis]RCV48638.1 hypothetical protein DEF24_26115 [Marinitenerispora sediminis]